MSYQCRNQWGLPCRSIRDPRCEFSRFTLRIKTDFDWIMSFRQTPSAIFSLSFYWVWLNNQTKSGIMYHTSASRELSKNNPRSPMNAKSEGARKTGAFFTVTRQSSWYGWERWRLGHGIWAPHNLHVNSAQNCFKKSSFQDSNDDFLKQFCALFTC